MNCYSCDLPLEDGQRVEIILAGELVKGEFQPTQEEIMRHYDCEDAS